MKALARLHVNAGSSKALLLAHGISTKIYSFSPYNHRYLSTVRSEHAVEST